MTLYIFNCFVLFFIFYVVLIAMGTRCGSLCGWWGGGGGGGVFAPPPPPPAALSGGLLWRNEETVSTYKGLLSPLTFQFFQMKSPRIFQLVTYVLKSLWPAVPLRPLSVLVLLVLLLVKQTLFLLQFVLLCADQLGEFKLQRDWSYDCMHCLVFFL